MKILITGINGFIGQSLVESLIGKECEVYGVDIQENSYLKLKKYYCIDISKKFFLEEKFDFVIHLAALSRTNVNVDYDLKTITKINVTGLKNTIASCEFKKIIFLSSALVYSRKTEKITESSEICLKSLYSKTKYEAENICKELLPANKFVILRPVNVIGIKQKNVAFMPVFFNKAINNEDINIFVPANKTMQILDISDLIRSIQLILENEIFGLYNVSSDESIEIRELVNKILKICNSKSRVIYSNDSLESKSIVDCNKIKKVLGWKAIKSIDEILLDYYNKKYSKLVF